jgi:HD superfamily phosphohydrolase
MVKDFLHSDKKIYDSVHGFIPFDEFEKELIDSLPFQRLHYIHQLGIAYLVYPGATHTRFEHSLGVMALATQMFEKVCKSVRPDVFHFVPRKGSHDYLYWRRVLRMAALCHDLGHLPFSHVAENDFLGAPGHESWTLKIIESEHLKPVWDKLKHASSYLEDLIDRDIIEDIKKVAIGEPKWQSLFPGSAFSPWVRIVSQIVTGDFFGSDRIDYLLRDAKTTGVAYGLFDYHQLIETLRILPSAESGVEDLQLGIDENGIESCEALLLARHFMRRRVYQYSSVKAYSFHLRRFMLERFPVETLKTVDDFLNWSDPEVIYALNRAARAQGSPGHEDAKCVFYRQHRFRAISLPDGVTEKDLASFKKKNFIKDHDIVWEFAKETPESKTLNFPVSRRHVVLQKAHDSSDLLLRIPQDKSNWAYISPKHDLEMLHFLENWNQP